MNINEAGLNLIKTFEKCRLVVYNDGYGYNTVGYGHKTSLPVGSRITATEAENLLKTDLKRYEECVNNAVKVNLNDNQFSALVCFTFNCGQGAFLGSKLLKLLNSGDFKGAESQFSRWNRVKGKISRGLTQRRSAELALFLSEV